MKSPALAPSSASLRPSRSSLLLLALGFAFLAASAAQASHISGLRITQTGNTGLEVNVDVTAFYTTGSTESTAYLGTYYNQIPAIAWGDGATTPRYGYGPSTGIPLVATSTVVNGIPARSYRGSFSHTYGAVGNYTIEANTRCCPLTTPTYTLVTGTILTETISTTGPFGPTTFTTSFVQNTLRVDAVAPGFDKVFAPDAVAIGQPSTLTFTIDNTGSTLDNNDLEFTDSLPAGLLVAPTPNATNTCTGGTLTATAGTGTISYTGGEVAAGSTCSISVDVTAASAGLYANTSGDLSSAFGSGGTASDTLTVFAPPMFAKAFAPDTVGIDQASTLTFTIDNSANPVDATGLAFTDTLPGDLVVATAPNASSTCTGGAITAVSGTGTISYTGGTATAGASCTVSVDVSGPTPGNFTNISGDLVSSLGNSGTATDTLIIAAPPTFSKEFQPDVTGPDVPSTLVFTIDNSVNTIAATPLNFTDTFPAGLTVATPGNVVNGCGGTVTAADGSGSVALSGGTVAAGATCLLSVDVVADAMGDFDNVSGDLTSLLGNSGSATATLTVNNAPGFSKAFEPDEVAPGQTTTLTFTIDNAGSTTDAMALAFVDNLPAGMTVADVPNVVDTCTGGTVTAAPGATSITYAGGSVAAGDACTISVDIEVDGSGEFENIADPLTSNLGSSGTATAVDILRVFNGIEIPTASTLGLGLLAGLLGIFALAILRRSRP